MARRGEPLRNHILDSAKQLFLESGFERTSMDAVAARAATSKRTLYAHFPTKEALFLASIDRMRELLEARMLTPENYSVDPLEAVVLYCGRFLQLLRWSMVIQTLRLGIAEADRLPPVATGLYDILFADTADRLGGFLGREWGLPSADAFLAAARLLGLTVNAELARLLLRRQEPTAELADAERIPDEIDLAPLREATIALLDRLPNT